MQYKTLSPKQMQEAQQFAFGGIANPLQRAKLRSSDQEYLDKRSQELEAYEAQRSAYNAGLTDYQDKVYKPYQEQATAYNTAAQKYNTEVYDPYKVQYGAYEKAVADYNAGPRTTDYAGPAEPVLSSRFDMQAPTAPVAFSMVSPEVPFKEEDVKAYQQEAAQRARTDATGRGLAIDVLADPDKYNFGSLSLSNRFMAEGGLVEGMPGGQARSMLQEMTGLVAKAGRGEDRELAYLSPPSVALLKGQGGAGTVNPATGLKEFSEARRASLDRYTYKSGGQTRIGYRFTNPFTGVVTEQQSVADLFANPNKYGFAEVLGPAESGMKGTNQYLFRPLPESKAEADEAARKEAEAEARRKAEAQAILDRAKLAERDAATLAAEKAARLAEEERAKKIMVRGPLTVGPVTGTSADPYRPIPATAFEFNTRALTPLSPVKLDDRYLSAPALPTGRGPRVDVPVFQRPRQDRPKEPIELPNFIDDQLNRGRTAYDIASPGDTDGRGAVTDLKNFFALDPSKPPSIAGLTPGTVSLAPLDLPVAAGKRTLEAIAANPNLTPNMLGGRENAGIRTDRLGNKIYSPAMPLLYAEGGEVDAGVEKDDEVINTDPVGTAKKFLSDVQGVRARPSSTRQSIKRSLQRAGGGASAPKEMGLSVGALSAPSAKGVVPDLVDKGSARQQMEELARVYQLKARAAQGKSRGLMAATFEAPTLEGATLTKNTLARKRFKKGGEVETFQLGGLVRGLKSGAKKGAPKTDSLVPSSARSLSLFPEEGSSLFPSIIKEEGGNWMGGAYSPETFVKPLYKAENLDNPANAKSLNKWIDKKLTPYIKNKMGTPSDPVRLLADREGILPFPDARNNNAVTSEVTAKINRQVAGLPIEQQAPIATTPRGQAWENKADAAIRVGPYQDMVPFGYSNDPDEVLREFGGEFAVQNPTAKVNAMNTGRGPSDLGFDHIVDVLQENLTTRRLSPDSLKGLSMEDAVRLTHQYDLDMADKMKKAQIQSLEGVPVYKQYPEQGFRWMQLDKPGYFAAESDAMGHSVRGYEPPVGHPDWTSQSGNRGSLGYGYYGGWEAIKSGDVKVYSLADDIGKRYTTIEQVPGTHPLGTTGRGNEFPDQIRYGGIASSSGETIPEEKLQEIYALGKKMYFENPNAFAENRILSGAPAPSPMDSFQKAADMVLGKRPPSINQIKGPVNGRIAEDAQPFVQDFLNSGNWSTVDDLSLTGLRDVRNTPEVEKYVKSNQLDDRRFLTEAEYNKYETDFLRGELKGQLGGFDPLAPVQPEGMAKGGMVQHFDGGGMAMSSPEESDSYSAEPAQFVKDMKSDYARLKASPTAREQLAKIAALQISQGGPDLAALGVEYLVDPLKSVTLDKVFTRPKFRSVLDKPANPKSPRIADQPQREPLLGSLSDALKTKDGNFIGSSEDVIKRAQDAKLMGPSRFSPLTEVGASLGLGTGAAIAKPTAKFLGTEAARQVERGIFNEGPLRAITPQPAFAVRPTGSVLNLGKQDSQKLDSGRTVTREGSPLKEILDKGRLGLGIDGGSPVLPNVQQFWDKKARNYFERQFGTPDDPIADALIGGKIKGGSISNIENFPSYITEQTLVGKTRRREKVNPDPEFVGPGTPETSRFYPKFPEAIEDLTRRYDKNTGLEGLLVTNQPGLTHPDYDNITSNLGEARERATSDFIEDKMIEQGVRPELINTQTSIVARSQKDPTKIVGSREGKKLLEEYEKASKGVATDMPMSYRTAIQKGEPIYAATNMRPIISNLFKPERVNQYLETLSAREIDAMRFEDVIANTNKMFIDVDNTKALMERISSGKRVPDSVFSNGVSSPLLQFDKNSGFEGFAWKRLETPDSTVPEGAYLGHSVGGYKMGGPTYTKQKMDAFITGEYRAYTLRDTRNRPVTTVEVRMLNENTPIVTQIKGNGRASGNTAPEDYDNAVLAFFESYLKPASVQEKDALLTPLLQRYKNDLDNSLKTR